MNSSLDIFYTNQNKEKREMKFLKKYPLLHNPLQVTLIRNNLKPIELYLYAQKEKYIGFYVIYNNI
jgi:hypothetical protein